MSYELDVPDFPAGHCDRCGCSMSFVDGSPTCTEDCNAWVVMDEITKRLSERGISIPVFRAPLTENGPGRGIAKCGSLYTIITWQKLSDIERIAFSGLPWGEYEAVEAKYMSMHEGMRS